MSNDYNKSELPDNLVDEWAQFNYYKLLGIHRSSTGGGNWSSKSSGTTYYTKNNQGQLDIMQQLYTVLKPHLIDSDTWNTVVNTVYAPTTTNLLHDNGYYLMPNNFMIQWGLIVSPSYPQPSQITFSKTFTEFFEVVATTESSNAASCSVANVNNAGFQIVAQDSNVNRVRWIALGLYTGD